MNGFRSIARSGSDAADFDMAFVFGTGKLAGRVAETNQAVVADQGGR